ncbi:hypothetical protein CDD83_1797 [Cordyceps sp. RAO-2017]|nr:hypothetical protein CDD83_1797 [Cordyceps sp. RAO-2017]
MYKHSAFQAVFVALCILLCFRACLAAPAGLEKRRPGRNGPARNLNRYHKSHGIPLVGLADHHDDTPGAPGGHYENAHGRFSEPTSQLPSSNKGASTWAKYNPFGKKGKDKKSAERSDRNEEQWEEIDLGLWVNDNAQEEVPKSGILDRIKNKPSKKKANKNSAKQGDSEDGTVEQTDIYASVNKNAHKVSKPNFFRTLKNRFFRKNRDKSAAKKGDDEDGTVEENDVHKSNNEPIYDTIPDPSSFGKTKPVGKKNEGNNDIHMSDEDDIYDFLEDPRSFGQVKPEPFGKNQDNKSAKQSGGEGEASEENDLYMSADGPDIPSPP